ncbi:hypothetical protein ETAA8_04090 [Anatilimnocola aggregata]|uniref:Uncharacterized protein n=1 Tax=Anatilimnocola aggregata TaxID=2528021 RepID=A0A517Y521_9BACT|nr:hypothetical protein ETAA8_04090 [Anatilimnocola aggregata]
MYIIVNITAVLSFIVSVMVGFYTYSKFPVLDGVQKAGLIGVFVALTVAWVSCRIWMFYNQHRNPKRRP